MFKTQSAEVFPSTLEDPLEDWRRINACILEELNHGLRSTFEEELQLQS